MTGASKGLGLECVRILLDKFACSVVTLSRSSTKELQDLHTQYSERLHPVQGDVTNEADQQVRGLATHFTNASRKAIDA